MASKATIEYCRAICRKYNIKYRFSKTNRNCALSHAGSIQVSTLQGDKQFVSAVFHEVQHCLNYRNKKYLMYHKKKIIHDGNRTRMHKLLKRWMLPAELYTDKEAKKLAEKHGFYNYQGYYSNSKECKTWVKNWIEKL